MAKIKNTSPDEIATARKASKFQGGDLRFVGKGELADVDLGRLKDIDKQLAYARKQERGIRKRISGIVRSMNMIANTYRRADEMFVRYLDKDKALLFRGRGNGKASDS